MRKLTQKTATPALLKVDSLSLTPADGAVLASLAQEATDQRGRRISTAAVVQGILRL